MIFMKKLHSIVLFCALALIASCSKETPERANPAPEIHGSRKIVGTRAGADLCRLLVKLSNADDVSAILSVEGVEKADKVFKSVKGKEELERQFGLDRWYEVFLREGEANDDVALRLAAIDAVSCVEYNFVCEQQNGGAYPACEPVAAATKAASNPFNDPYLQDQWAYRNIGDKGIADNAVEGGDINVFPVWDYLTAGDPDIVVAVVDEGVWYDHPDLRANFWTNTGEIPGNGIDDDGNGYVDDIHGYNFVDNGQISWAKPGDTGHGTFCAGVVAAVNNNGTGVCGIAGGDGTNPGCRIMSCQIFSGNKGGYSSQTANAIKYAADNGASVITCSFGYSTSFGSDNAYIASQGSVELDAIRYFEASKDNNPVLADGNIAVFSAGNEAHPYAHYPGAAYDIVCVSAIGPDMLPANYTDYGPGCNIAAPGGELGLSSTFRSLILSTVPKETTQKFDGHLGTGYDYGYMQGTSMACPMVSGVVALGLSYAKKLGKTFTRDQFKQLLLSSTQDIDKRIAATGSKSYVKTNFIDDASGKSYYYIPSNDLSLAPYYHQMGAGAVDAWQFMMQIEGTTCIPAEVGKKQWLSLNSELGSASVSLTYLDVQVDQNTIDALGLQLLHPQGNSSTNGKPVPEGDCYAYEQFGRLYIHPTKVGSGIVTIKVVGGGDHIGGGDNPPGGMELTRKVSIIARCGGGLNGTGGWL